jgi:hypothetical protein
MRWTYRGLDGDVVIISVLTFPELGPTPVARLVRKCVVLCLHGLSGYISACLEYDDVSGLALLRILLGSDLI